MKCMNSEWQRRSRALLLLFIDVVIINIASILALLVRFDFAFTHIPQEYLDNYSKICVVYTLITVVVFKLFKLYHSVWRFASLQEASHIAGAVTVGCGTHLIIMKLLGLRMPRSYYFLDYLLMLFGVIGVRFAYRGLRFIRRMLTKDKSLPAKRIMVIGAGRAGQVIIKEFRTSEQLNAEVCCVIDDNHNKHGRYINGVPIVGDRDCIIECVEKYEIEKIVVALPSASVEQRRDILQICQLTNCEVQILPGIYQLIRGEVNVEKLRKVQIEDLLGRDSIHVNLDDIMGYVKDKTIMVTGGGGSIGSELCRQIASYQPKQLVIVDIYENNAYDIQQELKRKYPELNLVTLIASVRNTHRINKIFEEYRPQIVYHAAAHKHVPLMEDSPNEAIKNNVFGTYKTATAADKYGVERFVLISTDKAVNPTNVMGASKRLCEMVVQNFNKKSKTEFVAVRFGNVLGSNGSVIPLFKKQIETGGPVTVTHPDIIRYFMTIPEAVSLVLQAGAYAKGGEIFILDMGEPVKIADLAKNLIRLSGYTPDVDMKIEYSGLRPGEKLYEELLMKEEGLKDTENSLIHIGRPIEFDEIKFEKDLERLYEACYRDCNEIKDLVAEVVPTYVKKEA
ncbi:MAG: nucleoside-diphosphate sugar epimerase/dehydratase [bacterium]|nr:nucleoside-diphosphate sugar epimerase/dehydratase [bacterium]